MNKVKNLAYGEIFCGPGGLALGALIAKCKKDDQTFTIEHAWASDYDESTCETYRNNICPDKPSSVICTNIENLNINELASIDIFAYGFPCNDFSSVGKKNGINGKYGGLYEYGINILDDKKPAIFLAENVRGIRTADDGDTLKKILKRMQAAGNGYNLTVHLYKAENYGVPQKRHRIIIVGFNSKLNLKYYPPIPTHRPDEYISVQQAIERIPIKEGAHNHHFTKQSRVVEARLNSILPGQNAWNADIPPEYALNVQKAKMSNIYRRLIADKPSYTITGSGGGGTHVYHWTLNRALTNRERARLQTFPDDFKFFGSKENVRRQVGMAVPPLLAKKIFKAVLKTYAGIEYRHLGEGNLDYLLD